MQIGKSITSKNCEDFGKTKNEDSRGLGRLYCGRNFVPKFRGNLFEYKNLKTTKIEEIEPEKLNHAP